MIKANNKITLIALITVFIVPVILAKFALKYNWFDEASTNHGELINPAINATQILKGDEPYWRLVYFIPEVCGDECKNAVYSMNQVRLAIGREMDRVKVTFLVSERSDASALESLQQENAIDLLMVNQSLVNKVFKDYQMNAIFIADTLDNVVLKYRLQQEKQQALMDSRDILADLRKLLKLSRIG